MDLQDMNGKQGSSCIKFSICSQKWEDSLDIQLFQQEKLAEKGRNDSFFKANKTRQNSWKCFKTIMPNHGRIGKVSTCFWRVFFLAVGCSG